MKYHIEFIGLPGSGKSTYLRLLRKILNSENQKAYELSDAYRLSLKRKTPKIFHRLFYNKAVANYFSNIFIKSNIPLESITSYIVENPRYIENLLSIQMNRIEENAEKKYVLAFLFYLCSQYEYVRSTLNDEESILIDEGFVYSFVKTLGMDSKIQESDVVEYLKYIPTPDIVIYVNGSPKLCEDRMSKRKSGYPGELRNYSLEKRLGFLTLCFDCVENIIEFLTKNGIFVVNLDSSRDIEKNVMIMKEQVINYIRND